MANYEYLIQHDKDLLDKMQIIIAPSGVSNVQSSPVGSGRDAFELCPANVQFPPKLMSDSKSANWKEKEVGAYEPIAVWFGAGSRDIKIELEYVVPSKIWTPKKVAGITRDIKRYFYKARLAAQFDVYPVVQIKWFDIVPSVANFRLIDYSAEFSDNIINYDGGIWPQHTKISMALKMQTRVSIESGPESGPDSEQGEFTEALTADPLKPIKAEWY